MSIESTRVPVTVRRNKRDKTPITVQYDFGGTVQGAVNKFGEEDVFFLFSHAVRQQLAEYVREMLAADPSVAVNVLQKDVDAFMPIVEKRKKQEIAKAVDSVLSLSPSVREEVLRQLSKTE